MAGYGNRTAPDISPSSLSHDHASTRLGLTDTHDVRLRSVALPSTPAPIPHHQPPSSPHPSNARTKYLPTDSPTPPVAQAPASHPQPSSQKPHADCSQPPTYAGGAGLGNKLSQTTSSSSSSHTADTAHATDEPLRFDSQARHGSAPYSNAHVYGSACTAGAGWGNKTGSFSDEGHGEGGRGSTLGRLVEKVGGVVGKGRGMRGGKGEGEGGAADGMVAN
ncbi:hypothetical protein G6514_005787 [Epicoccum nigrum]|nr:hypothetical protein G6514_005787 [Epicoccum nigrum]